MTASSQNQTGTQTNTPSQIGYLNTGFSDALGALNKSNSNAVTPDGFVANLTPDQLNTYRSIMGYANGNQTPQQQAALGAQLGTNGVSAVNGAVNGFAGFNPSISGEINAGNQYAAGQDIPGQVQAAMRDANQEATDVTLPGIDSAAAGTGNTNSSRTGVADGIVQRGLAQKAGDLSASLRANAYNTGAGLQAGNYGTEAGALASEGNLGVGAAGTGGGLLSSGVGDASALAGLGLTGASGGQTQQQNTFADQLQRYGFNSTAPFSALQQYMQLVGGYNAGGTQTGNQTTTSTPSTLSSIGAGVGMLGSLAGMGTGFGAASGLLGGLNGLTNNFASTGQPYASGSGGYSGAGPFMPFGRPGGSF